MKQVTQWVFADEPCYGLYEGPVAMPQLDGSTQERWIQDLTVVRNDQHAHYITDYGEADAYTTVAPMMMPSFGENTVAQLQAFAERNRHDDYWARRRTEMLESSTLVADHIRTYEQGQEVIRNRTTTGPYVTAQRNGYSHETVIRNWMDERARRTGKRSFAI